MTESGRLDFIPSLADISEFLLSVIVAVWDVEREGKYRIFLPPSLDSDVQPIELCLQFGSCQGSATSAFTVRSRNHLLGPPTNAVLRKFADHAV